jgi:hypothetical protein
MDHQLAARHARLFRIPGTLFSTFRSTHPAQINDHRLPYDVLRIIFLLVQQEWIERSRWDTIHVVAPVRHLAAVCRYWRDAALATGKLWTCIKLVKRLRPRLWKLWLDRSQNALLDITIGTFWLDPSPSRKHIDCAFDWIRPHLPRCGPFTLCTNSKGLLLLGLETFFKLDPIPPLHTFCVSSHRLGLVRLPVPLPAWITLQIQALGHPPYRLRHLLTGLQLRDMNFTNLLTL